MSSNPTYSLDSQSNDFKISPNNFKILIVGVAALLVITALVLLLHVYAKWWFLRQSQRRSLPSVTDLTILSHSQQTTVLASNDFDASDGLDASIIASLPLFIYNSDESKSVECVICITKLVDDDKARILPKCQHVFHVGCIDMWLHSHSTCPICRARLMPAELAALGSAEVISNEPRPQTSGDENVPITSENALIEVAVDIPPDLNLEIQTTKDSSASLSSPSSSSLSSSFSSSSSSSSLSASLRRMLSRSRAEIKVFPSSQVNEN